MKTAVGLADIAPVGMSFTSGHPNSVYGLLGRGLRIAFPSMSAVVHQYPRTLAGQIQRVGAPQPFACTRHHCALPMQAAAGKTHGLPQGKKLGTRVM